MPMTQQESSPPGGGASAGGIAHEAQAAAGDVAAEARAAVRSIGEQTSEIAGAAKEELGRQADAGKDMLADRISSFADHVRSSTQGLRREEAWLADLLDEGVRQLSGVADSLKGSDARGLIGTIDGF